MHGTITPVHEAIALIESIRADRSMGAADHRTSFTCGGYNHTVATTIAIATLIAIGTRAGDCQKVIDIVTRWATCPVAASWPVSG